MALAEHLLRACHPHRHGPLAEHLLGVQPAPASSLSLMEAPTERACPPTVESLADCAAGWVHPHVRAARAVLATDEDRASGLLVAKLNVGLYSQAVWEAAPGVGVGGGVGAGGRCGDGARQ